MREKISCNLFKVDVSTLLNRILSHSDDVLPVISKLNLDDLNPTFFRLLNEVDDTSQVFKYLSKADDVTSAANKLGKLGSFGLTFDDIKKLVSQEYFIDFTHLEISKEAFDFISPHIEEINSIILLVKKEYPNVDFSELKIVLGKSSLGWISDYGGKVIRLAIDETDWNILHEIGHFIGDELGESLSKVTSRLMRNARNSKVLKGVAKDRRILRELTRFLVEWRDSVRLEKLKPGQMKRVIEIVKENNWERIVGWARNHSEVGRLGYIRTAIKKYGTISELTEFDNILKAEGLLGKVEEMSSILVEVGSEPLSDAELLKISEKIYNIDPYMWLRIGVG